MRHVSNIGNLFSGLYKRKSTVRRVSKASSDAGPELAGRESHCGDGKPVGPDCPLEKGGVGGLRQVIRCRPKNSEAVALRFGAHEGLIAPLKGSRRV